MGKYSGEYKAPAHKASTVRGSYMSDESSGVEYGLSARKDFDSEMSSDFNVNNETSVSGNPRQAIGKKKSYKVSEKGHSFDLGGE
jgi:hypothetical protein